MTIVWPVMFRAAGETRKLVTPASSSMLMNTPFGIGLSMIWEMTSDSGIPRITYCDPEVASVGLSSGIPRMRA